MIIRLRSAARRAGLLLVVVLATAGCAVFGGGDTMTLYAEFDDALDLVDQAHVRAGDVPIGVVTNIALTDDLRARVTMEIDAEGHGLPHETAAWLSKTSMLGERFIDLRPVGESGSLEDGQLLTETRIISDFEELVEAGSDALAFVSAQQLAAMVQTGATAFGGRGGLLGQFLTDVEAFIGRYDEGQGDLVHLIDELDGLTAQLAPNATQNAEGFAVLERASRSLQDEDDRLLDALEELRALSQVGDRIMREHRQEIDNSVRRLRIVLDQITRIDGAFENLLLWGPRHNLHVPNGVTDHFAQVWLDFLVCGMNDTEGDPSRDCTPPNPGEHADPPPYHPNDPACNESHEHCEGEQRDER